MPKKLILFFSGVLIIVASLVTVLYFPLTNPTKIFYTLFDNGFTIQSNGQVQPRPVNESYSQNSAKYYSRLEVVVTGTNPFNPIISSIEQDKNNEKSFIINQLYLQRNYNSINSFQVENRITSFADNIDFTELKSLVEKNDLNKNNPRADKIQVRPAPTKEKVEKQKQLESDGDKKLNDPEYQKEYERCYSIGLLHPGQEERYLYDCINPYNREKGYSESK